MFEWLPWRRKKVELPPTFVVEANGRCLFMHDERQLTIHRSLCVSLYGTGLWLQATDEVVSWLRTMDEDFESKVSFIVKANAIHGMEVPETCEFHFTDATLAMMFKLAWGGKECPA